MTVGVLAGVLALAVGVVHGQETEPSEEDSFKFRFGETLTHDSNLFRLPGGVSPAGGLERSSLLRTDMIGFAWAKRHSLQRLRAEASFEHHDYSNHDFLDFNAINGKLGWDWSLTPHLTGVVSFERKQGLVGFNDYRNLSTRNLRTNETLVAAADYAISGGWHLVAAAIDYSSVSEDNSQPVEDAFSSRGLQTGVKYVFPSNSYLSYVVRRENGDYPFSAVAPATLLDTEFRQYVHEVQAAWAVTTATTLGARLSQIEREHPNVGARDFSGTAGRLDLNWKITDKTRLLAVLGRELTTFQTDYSNYIVTDSLSLAPVWQITPKTALKLQLAHSRRDFRGTPFGPVDMREDRIFTRRIELNWEATRTLGLIAALQHDRRESSYTGFDFKATMLLLGLRVAF